MKCTSSEAFSAQEVRDAYVRIKPYIYRTPLEESLYLSEDGRRYFFKLECAQTVKSFKLRGALSKMTTLTEEESRRGVATISSGNHGASVSYAAQLLGLENAVVIVPETTPKAKVDKIRFYGAQALLLGKNYDEAHRLGMAYIEEHGMTYIDAYYDDPKIYGGQGTIALEILEQNPQIAVYAKSVRPDIRIVGVQTEACPAMIRAFADDVFYEEYPVTGDTVCDALVGGVGKLAFDILRDYIDDIIEVKEASIRKAVKYMIKEEKFIVEGASAATVAAVMDNRDRVGGQNVALVMSGGNIDGELMVQLLNA